MERGDVFHVDLNPIQRREQAVARYVAIVSPKAFNVLGTPLVWPITQGGNFAVYSSRKACDGRITAARIAGNKVAATQTAIRQAVAPAIDIASQRVTP